MVTIAFILMQMLYLALLEVRAVVCEKEASLTLHKIPGKHRRK